MIAKALADKTTETKERVLGISGIYDARPKKPRDTANALIGAWRAIKLGKHAITL